MLSEKMYAELQERKQQLEAVHKALLAAMKKHPEGNLRISTCKGHKRYYHYTSSKDHPGGIYIRKDNLALASALAQKSYDETLSVAVL